MLLIAYFKWWYGVGWKNQLDSIISSTVGTINAFSVKILLKTMFRPWKQITTKSYADTALEDRIKALVDNLVSRTIGFFVRLITLLIAFIAIIAIIVLKVLLVLVWPILPVMPIVLVVVALTETVS